MAAKQIRGDIKNGLLSNHKKMKKKKKNDTKWEGLNQNGGAFSTIFRTATGHRKIKDFPN